MHFLISTPLVLHVFHSYIPVLVYKQKYIQYCKTTLSVNFYVLASISARSDEAFLAAADQK